MNKQTVIQWLKYAAIAAISLFFLLLILGGLVFGYYASKAPTLSEKDLIATTSSKIYDNQNNLIADLGAEKRINVKTNEIPTDLVNAIVAIEDHSHTAVNQAHLLLYFFVRPNPISENPRSLACDTIRTKSH